MCLRFYRNFLGSSRQCTYKHWEIYTCVAANSGNWSHNRIKYWLLNYSAGYNLIIKHEQRKSPVLLVVSRHLFFELVILIKNLLLTFWEILSVLTSCRVYGFHYSIIAKCKAYTYDLVRKWLSLESFSALYAVLFL